MADNMYYVFDTVVEQNAANCYYAYRCQNDRKDGLIEAINYKTNFTANFARYVHLSVQIG